MVSNRAHRRLTLKGEGIEVARNMAAQLTPFWSGVASVEGARHLFKKTLSVSLALGAPEIAAALVRPFRLEQLTPSVVAELVGVIERYGVECARDAFAEWSSHGSEGFAEARIAWLGSVQVFIRAVAATGSVAARQFARWLVSEQWTWLTERYLAAARDLPSRVLEALARLDQPLLGLIESNVALGGSEARASMQRFLTSEERPVLALVSLLESAHRTYRGHEVSALGLGVVHAHRVAELTRRLSRAVRAPDDWSIAPPKQCSCSLCLELARFLADRTRIRFDWPLAADKRAHIHRAVTAHELPVTHVTRRSGRPYTLVLVKTKALFERETTERIAWQRALDRLTHRERAFQERVGRERERDPKGQPRRQGGVVQHCRGSSQLDGPFLSPPITPRGSVSSTGEVFEKRRELDEHRRSLSASRQKGRTSHVSVAPRRAARFTSLGSNRASSPGHSAHGCKAPEARENVRNPSTSRPPPT